MEFHYGRNKPTQEAYENQFFEQHHYESVYGLKRSPPPWEMVQPDSQSLRPFEEKHTLTERLFSGENAGHSDSILLPMERARLQGKQVSLILEQMTSRHAINEQIRKDLQYTESRVSSKLSEINDRFSPYGTESRFASELFKELNQIQKARHAEHVSCWRDTNRLMGDLFESWREYEENNAKGRLMDFDL